MNPADFDVTLIARMVETFGFHETEAARLILKWQWVAGDLDLWEVHLRRLGKDPKIRKPPAACAALMRKQKHPQTEVPGEDKAQIVLSIIEESLGKLYRGKKEDYWKVIPQGLQQIEDGRVLLWSAMTMEDLRKLRAGVQGTKSDNTNAVGYQEWLRSEDCRNFLDDRKVAGIDMTWVERLREKALAGAPVSPGELLK